MKIVGRATKIIVCEECGSVIQHDKSDLIEEYVSGYDRTYIKCPRCGMVMSECCRGKSVIELNEPGKYIYRKWKEES